MRREESKMVPIFWVTGYAVQCVWHKKRHNVFGTEEAHVFLRMKVFGECNFGSVILLAIIHPSRSIFGYMDFKLNKVFKGNTEFWSYQHMSRN